MAKNLISTLPTKAERQLAKLQLAETKRQQAGTIGYRELRYLDITELPTVYAPGNNNTRNVIDNPNIGGLVIGRPWKTTPNILSGLWRSVHTGYWSGAPEWFDLIPPIEESQVSDFNLAPFNGTYTSYQWLGYFRAPHTANYTFYVYSDDEAMIWIGNKAITAYNSDNTDLYTSAPSGELNTAPISLDAGDYIPIRIMYGNNAGEGYFSFSWSDDYTPPPIITAPDLQYAGAQWTGSPVLDGAAYTNAGWDYIGFNNAGLYSALFNLIGNDGQLAVTWSAGSTVTSGYVRVNFDGNTTFQFVPVIDAGGNDNYPGTWIFPATFSAIP